MFVIKSFVTRAEVMTILGSGIEKPDTFIVFIFVSFEYLPTKMCSFSKVFSKYRVHSWQILFLCLHVFLCLQQGLNN